jgi:hypothetical protein
VLVNVRASVIDFYVLALFSAASLFVLKVLVFIRFLRKSYTPLWYSRGPSYFTVHCLRFLVKIKPLCFRF